jgi:hypothetical protein
MPRLAFALLAASIVAACSGSQPAGIDPPDGEPPALPLEGDVLFIGNSLTAANDLPGMVQSLADSAGETRLTTAAVTLGGAALEDHWSDGTALRAIRRGGWRFVVLQQGPSSLPESRVNLREWTRRFAGRIRAVGAEPALYTVWPPRDRMAFFDDVIESYRIAAQDVQGVLLPVGQAWVDAWGRDATLALYGPDDFHPSVEGSYLAALVIYAQLSGRSPIGLPARFALPSGKVLEIGPGPAALLQETAAHVVDGAAGVSD